MARGTISGELPAEFALGSEADPIRDVQALSKRLSRLLSPTTMTTAGPYGQDPYSFTP